jgi:hypothetical protein
MQKMGASMMTREAAAHAAAAERIYIYKSNREVG